LRVRGEQLGAKQVIQREFPVPVNVKPLEV
jgi:hypothetical protein